ncbi:metallophosphatase [Erysipelotrichaceae bacterium AF15-26LB]|nr:Ser/Thr phosphatase family protein [Erysipelotrichaceae bacterium 3_1_53]MCR0347774.1 metallophosphoesterase [[Clostridium] innocuum]RJV92397.1 metallophosphatase [Erysipelotrichaceae bacterium AF15-26LB]RJV92646.1 metallophosphatase [Erysipelotrichaceae bacterium AF19-24AC]
MIYITGDCHGTYEKLSIKRFPEQKEMTKNDYVIVAGDFGFWSQSKEQNFWLDWLEQKTFTTLWADGNHENYDLLKEYPIEYWNGGMVQFITPSVIHLLRGQIYFIEDASFFIFGGASSHDISGGILNRDDPLFMYKRKYLNRIHQPYRIEHESWWKEEMPSQQEMDEGLKNLEKINFNVDYIVTHCCSSSTQDLLSCGKFSSDRLTDYFETLKKKVEFKKWYFGHYHQDRFINEKEIVLYDRLERIK